MSEEQEFERLLGHEFSNRKLIAEVRTHASLLNEPGGAQRVGNSRLAHLGDAVVGLAVRHALFKRFPKADKAKLTEDAKGIVSNAALAPVAHGMGIGRFLETGASLPTTQHGVRVLAGLFEAAIGAVFLDSNFETAAQVTLKHVVLPPLDDAT